MVTILSSIWSRQAGRKNSPTHIAAPTPHPLSPRHDANAARYILAAESHEDKLDWLQRIARIREIIVQDAESAARGRYGASTASA